MKNQILLEEAKCLVGYVNQLKPIVKFGFTICKICKCSSKRKTTKKRVIAQGYLLQR